MARPYNTSANLPRQLEISTDAYDEIKNKLIESGHDWMVWDNEIDLEGFLLVKEPKQVIPEEIRKAICGEDTR
jgi:hypothetical protein